MLHLYSYCYLLYNKIKELFIFAQYAMVETDPQIALLGVKIRCIIKIPGKINNFFQKISI